jgi:polyphosphate glucokinase
LEILGVDIGGTGIKGAMVDVATGVLVSDRFRLPTPENASPDAIAEVVREITNHFNCTNRFGCTVPARVEHGLVRTAANIHEFWIDTQVDELFAEKTGCDVTILNDADAAGLASMKYGAGRGRNGIVFFLTVGTGIGSAMFLDGQLIPGTELGMLTLRGQAAELYASARARKRDELDWDEWAARFQEYLDYVEYLFAPDTIILGGGISRPKRVEQYISYLSTKAELLIAELQNEAGIIGAAYAASADHQ